MIHQGNEEAVAAGDNRELNPTASLKNKILEQIVFISCICGQCKE